MTEKKIIEIYKNLSLLKYFISVRNENQKLNIRLDIYFQAN